MVVWYHFSSGTNLYWVWLPIYPPHWYTCLPSNIFAVMNRHWVHQVIKHNDVSKSYIWLSCWHTFFLLQLRNTPSKRISLSMQGRSKVCVHSQTSLELLHWLCCSCNQRTLFPATLPCLHIFYLGWFVSSA